MVHVAGFADVLTSPFSPPSVDLTGVCLALRDSFPVGDPLVAGQTHPFDWELDGQSCHGTFFTVTPARPRGQNGPFLYAVKRLKPEWRRSSVGTAVMNRETELGRLISHPHLVPTLDANTEEDDPFLVQPWLQGKTLQEFLSLGRRAKPFEAIWIARQIAEALAALEHHGFCHSDVKPGNIIVSPNGHATLIDLGLSRRTGEPSLPMDRAVCGTPGYMAPESAEASHSIDIRADLYSLGLVLLEMLFGKTVLISGESSARVHVGQWHELWHPPAIQGTAKQVGQARPGLAELEPLLRSMTDIDRSKRPDSAEILVRRLISIELAWI